MPTTSSIHPTAQVSKRAELGEGVVVGAYAVIERGAVLGAGTVIDPHAVIRGAATLGENCRVHPCAIVGDDPQDLGFRDAPTRLLIGDHTVIREHATVHRSTNVERPTTIGAHVLMMASSHVAHDCVVSNHAVICNASLVAGHSHIGERAFLSGNTVIHQFCRVGKLVMLSGLSGVGRDIGPYLLVAGRSVVQGLNVVGMRRAGMTPAQRVRVKEAYRCLFGAPNLAAGIDAVRALGIEHSEIAEIATFYAGSRRGFSRPKASHRWNYGESQPDSSDLP
ncbi:MAG TPA: acyl-ACP--UDP-N-acetylglucosamine O-acyltransferase [Planctomycetota bacterium]|nr:acyl-ACP--UDP-N-acetylglucosamine O-acyltransferase [Planctomycetota bacterium]